MLKVGLVGFGFMGRMNFDHYVKLNEDGYPITLTAVCDPRIEELKGQKANGNMNTAREVYDLSAYHLYRIWKTCWQTRNWMPSAWRSLRICMPKWLVR